MVREEDQNEEILPSEVTEEAGYAAKKKQKIPSLKGRRDNAIQGSYRGTLPWLNFSGTNDSSIVSKRSVERMGYDVRSAHHQFLRYFVKNPARRAPLINIGYFTRMKAIEKVVGEVNTFLLGVF